MHSRVNTRVAELPQLVRHVLFSLLSLSTRMEHPQQSQKSAALKVWMEGGSIDGTIFEAVGRNHTTGELFIEVDVIPVDDLDLQPAT